MTDLVDVAQLFKPHTPLDSRSAQGKDGQSDLLSVRAEEGGHPPPSNRIIVPRMLCNHPIHPAYAKTYEGSDCPRCSLGYIVTCLEGARGLIESHGGAQQWMASGKDLIRLKAIKKGGDANHKMHTFVDQYGNDLSHRHSKKRLVNEMLKLEQLAKQESDWEWDYGSRFPWENRIQVEQRLAEYHESSAKTALQLYWAAEAEGAFTRIEKQSDLNMRNRGRENQIIVEVDYPADEEPKQNTMRTKSKAMELPKTAQQIVYIKQSRLPVIVEPYACTTDIISPLKRKRRNVHAKVSFDPEVKVCLDNDIDVLRKQVHTNTSTNSAEGVTYGRSRSILRTVTPHDGTSNAGSDYYENTNLSYTSVALNTEDEIKRYKGTWRRRESMYRPGSWQAASDGEYVDTSGCNKPWGHSRPYSWGNYIGELHDEADRRDVGEYYRLQEAMEEKKHREREEIALGAEGFRRFANAAQTSLTWLRETVLPFVIGNNAH
jgi:hypothetical protein